MVAVLKQQVPNRLQVHPYAVQSMPKGVSFSGLVYCLQALHHLVSIQRLQFLVSDMNM